MELNMTIVFRHADNAVIMPDGKSGIFLLLDNF